MIYIVWIGILVAGLVAVCCSARLIITLSTIYYKLYCNTESTTYTIGLITVSALTLPLLSLLLIPIDVYVISTTSIKRHSDIHLLQDYIHYAYIVLYAITLFYIYILLPYAYFYYEELDDTTNQLSDNVQYNVRQLQTSHSRKTALKYTLVFTTTSILLTLVLWLILHNALTQPSTADTWQDRIMEQFSDFANIIWFNIGLLSCIGLCVFLTYTVYGLATLPIQWLRTSTTVDTTQQLHSVLEQHEVTSKSPLIRTPQSNYSQPLLGDTQYETPINTVQFQIQQNNENIKYLKSKYTTLDTVHNDTSLAITRSPLSTPSSTVSSITHSPRMESMSYDDKKELVRLQRLNKQLEALQTKQDSTTTKMSNMLTKIWNVLFPIRLLIAFLLFVTSVFIVVSLAITSLDRVLHSDCGFKCGYELEKLQWYNPIDMLMNFSAQYWPVDFILFTTSVLYIYTVTIYGLHHLGVRLIVLKLYNMQHNRTYPHAMILAAWQLLLLVYVIDLQLLTLIPTYITFGNQFADSQYTPCTLEIADQNDYCVMTQISKFLYAMNIDMSLFQSLIICSNGIFVLFYVLTFLTGIVQQQNHKHTYYSDDDLINA